MFGLIHFIQQHIWFAHESKDFLSWLGLNMEYYYSPDLQGLERRLQAFKVVYILPCHRHNLRERWICLFDRETFGDDRRRMHTEVESNENSILSNRRWNFMPLIFDKIVKMKSALIGNVGNITRWTSASKTEALVLFDYRLYRFHLE